jgi:hypothetical protein
VSSYFEAGDAHFTVIPCCYASGGSCGCGTATRFCPCNVELV